MMTRSNSRLRHLSLLLAFIVLGLATLPFLSSRKANSAMESITSVVAKERAYMVVLSSLKDAETGQRGFLLANNESFLEPYNAGVASLPTALDEIAKQAQSKAEKEVAAKISAISHEKIVEMGKTISFVRAGRSDLAQEAVAGGVGKQLMDRLRELIGTQLRQLAEQRVALRSELASSLEQNNVLSIGASIISMIVILAALFLALTGFRKHEEAAKSSQQHALDNELIAQKTTRQNEQLSLSAEMLQTVVSVDALDELNEVLSIFLKKLFPSTSGAIYLYRNSRDMLERTACWGAANDTNELIKPTDCWALRLGKPHQGTPGADLQCAHRRKDLSENATQLCFPMLSQGDVNGLMVITAPGAALAPFERSFIITVAEQLGLAINNVRLRNTLRKQSTIDPLTGLYNRRYFDESLRREMIRAQRKQTSVSVVMIDLDHFKQINDTYGHDGGDLVLREVAQQILGRIRGSDVACRYGGEEIVLLLPDCTAQDAAVCAENIRGSLAQIKLHNLGQTIAQVSASFGVAAWPEHANDEKELLKAADRSLYIAKKGGRNRVSVAVKDTDDIA